MSLFSMQSVRSVSRLTAILFAVQMLVTGFCMLTPQAHAMPTMMQATHVDAHCAKHQGGRQGHHASGQSDECYHCDQPDGLSNTSSPALAKVQLVLPGMIMLPDVRLLSFADHAALTVRVPTGPPRSSSLIYHITQRIRV